MTDAASPRADALADDRLRDLIARAVETGIVTRDQARRLVLLAAEGPGAEVARDDENLRFVTGFADIFVTIGLGLVFGALVALAGHVVGFVVIAATAWGLAEFFTRRKRMALPSIVLLVVFAIASFTAFSNAFHVTRLPFTLTPRAGLQSASDLYAMTAASAGTLGLIALHYRRFRVPVTVAAGMAALAATCVALLLALAPELRTYLNVLLVLSGFATFALAMRFDLADPARVTRMSDIAFWLHLLAAPLIVHPVLQPLLADATDVASGTSVTILAIVLLLSVVALVTDRRAILVSGLTYAGIALGGLFREIGITSWTIPMTILCLGAFVLLLSAGWHPLRRTLLRLMPQRIARLLPRPVFA